MIGLCQFTDHQTGIVENIQLLLVDKNIKHLAAALCQRIDDIAHHIAADLHFRTDQIIALYPIIFDLDMMFFQNLRQFF